MQLQSVLLIVTMIGAVIVVGCGEAPPALPKSANFGSEDGLQIAQLLEDFNEAKNEPSKLAKLFAGKAPSSVKNYDRLMFSLVGKPEVMADAATADVDMVNDADGKSRGKAKWTFTKVDGKWKLKDAPTS
jgi:hypothetical protein